MLVKIFGIISILVCCLAYGNNYSYDYNGNSIVLLDGGGSLFEKYHAIQNAKYSIDLQTLEFYGDLVGMKFAELLIKKREEGLKIRVIVDPVVNGVYGLPFFGPYFCPYFSNTRRLLHNLMATGVKVEGYADSTIKQGIVNLKLKDIYGSYLKRMHEKILIIDKGTEDQKVFIGGMNIANSYYGIGEKPFLDNDLLISGPVVADIIQNYEDNFFEWEHLYKRRRVIRKEFNNYEPGSLEYFNHKNRYSKLYKHPLSQKEMIEWNEVINKEYKRAMPFYGSMNYYHSRPNKGEGKVESEFLKLIKNAKREILIKHAYFLPNKKLRNALTEASSQGVKIKIISNHIKNNNELMLSTVAGRLSYFSLIKSGIEIYEWKGKKQTVNKNSDKSFKGFYTLHTKIMVIDDDVVVIGSANFDKISIRKNSENFLVVRSVEFNKEMKKIWENNIEYTRKVSEDKAFVYAHPKKIRERLKEWEGKLYRTFL